MNVEHGGSPLDANVDITTALRTALRDVRHEGHAWIARVYPDSAVRFTEGHFPGDPILPGALLLGLWLELARATSLLSSAGHAAIRRARFHHPVRPDRPFDVRLRLETDSIHGEIHVDGVLCATCTLEPQVNRQ